MRRRSDKPENWDELRDRIIGLGEQSSRKSYYPELRARVRELEETRKSLAELNSFLQAVMDAATEVAVIATSPEGIIRLFNQGAEKLLGYRNEEVIGQMTPLSFHLSTEVTRRAEELRNAFGTAVEGFHALIERTSREGSEKREWTYARKDGREVPVELVVTTIRENGRVTGYLFMAEDISERKRAERELNKHRDHLEEMVKERTAELEVAKERAEVANQAKSAFVSSMSHELRTPLNAILGYAQILRRHENLTETQQQQLEILRSSGEHLLILINDILDMGKIEAQKMELEEGSFNVGALLRQVLNITRIKAEEKDLGFHYEPITTLPGLVRGDERKLRQILLNLLSNAVKYTRRGKVTLRVSYGKSGSGILCCEIADTGIGIAQEKLQAIFEPFTQLTAEGETREGTGLGLTITKRLITLMHGKLAVESEPGKGSTFRLELTMPEVHEAEIVAEKVERPIVGYRGQRRTILVVDDNVASLSMMVSLLEPLGFRVVTAVSGQEALLRATEDPPDLMLLDLMMPGMDGLDVMEELSLRNLGWIRVIGVSATVLDSARKEEFVARCRDFLPKPVRIGDVLDKIQAQLGIDWVMSATEASPAPAEAQAAGELVVPPKEELAELHSLAMMGDMQKIQEWAAALEEKDERYRAFAGKLRELATAFRAKAITMLVEQKLNSFRDSENTNVPR